MDDKVMFWLTVVWAIIAAPSFLCAIDDIKRLSEKARNAQDKALRKSWRIRNYVKHPALEFPAGYVYLIHEPDITNRYKIGRTSRPPRRINKFDTIWAFDFKIIAFLKTDDCKGLEEQLHARFEHKRVRGEWFDLSEDDVKDILQTAGP